MPKDMFIDPSERALAGHLAFPEIAIRAYARPFAEERAARGDPALIEILRWMLVLREFETMLTALKAEGRYAGLPYLYKGPAHLSIGQEAAAVGAALALCVDDHIFGSHRSHGEFLAKGLAAIAGLDGARRAEIMAGHRGGALVRALGLDATAAATREAAEDFLLLGLTAEIFMKADGFNGGMGGSMHAFFPPFGAYPNNAIVGASAGIAAGSGLYKALHARGSIAVAMAGDGSTGCGPVTEAMNFAAMAQYETLWDEAHRGGLPVLFFFTNNFYAMGGQTSGETMGWDRLSRIGAGINPAALHAETVDGGDPLAVADAVARKRALLIAGKGPALLDIECYRISGHSPTDANAYRSREEIAAWQARDPIAVFAGRLVDAGILAQGDLEAMRAATAGRMGRIYALAIDPAVCPPVDVASDPLTIGRLMFAQPSDEFDKPANYVPLDRTASSRVRQLEKKSRSGIAADGSALSPMRAVTIRDALFEAILDRFESDPSLIAYGEECREWGGAFGVYRGLSEILPHHRLFNAPISEAAIVASAVGYALEGGRALVELMYADFIGRAGDEIFNQMAKWQAMSGGLLRLPVVLRTSVGSKYGAQHSQDWSALIAHMPGLKLAYPATPYDAKGLMAEALAGDDPVVFLESQRLYDTTETLRTEGVPTESYRIPFGVPEMKRAGRDATILTIGPTLYPALAAADDLEASSGVSVEIIDARSLVPFDYAAVLASIEKTGRLLVVTEACERGSFAMTIAANVTRFGFASLKAPPRVLGAPNWIVPGADMETSYFPQAHDIIDIVLGELIGGRQVNRRGIRTWDDLDLARRGL